MDCYNIIIVDDHTLFSNSLKKLVESFQDYKVIQQLANGLELVEYFNQNGPKPELILLDIRMPKMDGIETMKWIKQNLPDQKVLVLSMEDNNAMIIAMLRYGAKGYVLKDIDPIDFKIALDEVVHKGFHYSNTVNQTLLKEVMDPFQKDKNFGLNERELAFLQLACTEKTYKEIASDMFLSPKTIDGYREGLFKKFQVKSRVGLVLFSIRHNLIEFD